MMDICDAKRVLPYLLNGLSAINGLKTTHDWALIFEIYL